MPKYTQLSTSLFCFSSLQGETGRPGMPGEKGDIGAVVSHLHHHPHPPPPAPIPSEIYEHACNRDIFLH